MSKRLQARSPIRFILLVCLDCRSSAQFGRSEITQSLVPGSVRSLSLGVFGAFGNNSAWSAVCRFPNDFAGKSLVSSLFWDRAGIPLSQSL